MAHTGTGGQQGMHPWTGEHSGLTIISPDALQGQADQVNAPGPQLIAICSHSPWRLPIQARKLAGCGQGEENMERSQRKDRVFLMGKELSWQPQ